MLPASMTATLKRNAHFVCLFIALIMAHATVALAAKICHGWINQSRRRCLNGKAKWRGHTAALSSLPPAPLSPPPPPASHPSINSSSCSLITFFFSSSIHHQLSSLLLLSTTSCPCSFDYCQWTRDRASVTSSVTTCLPASMKQAGRQEIGGTGKWNAEICLFGALAQFI